MTNSNRSEISLDTSYLPCGFAYIRRHSDNTPCKVFRLAAIVHFGLLSPPCAFPGIQIIRHSAHRFFALSSTASYLLSGSRQPSHPARIFSGIFPDPFYLLPAHVTLVLNPALGLGKVCQREKGLRLVKEILYPFLWLIHTRCYFLVSISKYENSLQERYIGKSDCFAYLCEKFPALSTEKLKAGIFYGSRIWRLDAGQIFSTYLDNPRKNAWRSLAVVVENFLGYLKAPNYYDLSKQLNSFEKLGCNMSVKVHFCHSL